MMNSETAYGISLFFGNAPRMIWRLESDFLFLVFLKKCIRFFLLYSET